MSKFIYSLLVISLITLGCTSPVKTKNTVRPTKPDDPLEDVPPTISKLLPEEITPENYKAKVQQFERELTREMKTPEKEPAPTVKTEKKK